jgi:hypothetical protein
MGILTIHTHRGALLAGLLAGSVLLTGCLDMFKPARPTPPGGGGGSTIVPLKYADADQTLETMALAMANKNQSNGADAWIGAFADPATDNGATVEFDFDPGVLHDAGLTTPPAWNLVLEGRFYTYMSDVRTQPYYLEWKPWAPGGNDETDAALGTAYRPREYRLYTLDETGNTSGLVAIGIAQLYFKKATANRWAVVRWIDSVNPAADPNDVEQKSFSSRRLSSPSQ